MGVTVVVNGNSISSHVSDSVFAHFTGILFGSTGLGLMEPALPDLVAAYVADPSEMGTAQGATNSVRSFTSIVAPLVASAIFERAGGFVSHLCAAASATLC